MKKILIFAVLAALLVGLPFVSKLTRGTDAKQVEVQTVELKLIKSSILASGTLAYREQVQLRSEVIGQGADIFTAAYPDSPLSGTIQSIASVARQTPGQASLSFLVKILLDEQDAMIIRPGMSVRADIYTQSSEETPGQ